MQSDGYILLDKHEQLIGYVLYDKNDTDLEIIRLGVHPFHRKCGHGTRLLEKVKSKLTTNKNKIVMHVPDHMLEGHLFLQHSGFIASRVDYNHYYRHHIDSYHFIYLRDWMLSENIQPLNEEDVVAEAI